MIRFTSRLSLLDIAFFAVNVDWLVAFVGIKEKSPAHD